MVSLRRKHLGAILVLILTFALPCLAQKKGGGGGGSSASNANTASSAAPATTGGSAQGSTAPIEEQMLAFKSLDRIAQKIAMQVCSRTDIQSDPSRNTVILFDQTTFANIGAYAAFVANAQVVKAAFETLANENPKPKGEAGGSASNTFTDQLKNALKQHVQQLEQESGNNKLPQRNRDFAANEERHMEKALDAFPSPVFSAFDPISDFTALMSAIATAANTETAGTIVIPDSAVAVAVARELNKPANGCATSPQVVYPPLFGAGSATDISSADIQSEIQIVDAARDIAIEDVNAAFTKSQSKDLPGGNSLLNTELTDIDGIYDSFMNSLLQVNSSTGMIGSASVIQGYQLARMLAGYPDADGKPSKPRAFVLLASVLSAGGTEHDHKNFWRALGPGDQISYSGGIIVNVSLWRAPDATTAEGSGTSPNTDMSSDNKPIWSDQLRYRIGFTKFETPKGGDIGDSIGRNLNETPPPVQPNVPAPGERVVP